MAARHTLRICQRLPCAGPTALIRVRPQCRPPCYADSYGYGALLPGEAICPIPNQSQIKSICAQTSFSCSSLLRRRSGMFEVCRALYYISPGSISCLLGTLPNCSLRFSPSNTYCNKTPVLPFWRRWQPSHGDWYRQRKKELKCTLPTSVNVDSTARLTRDQDQ